MPVLLSVQRTQLPKSESIIGSTVETDSASPLAQQKIRHRNPLLNPIEAYSGAVFMQVVRQRALSDDLSLEGLGVEATFLLHGRPLKKAKNGVRKVYCPDGYLPSSILA
ncbi:hypothetical protein [Pseudomonas sp. OVF7]|uniref:hypothetical protein n=1 Tax=unclassified Pseudomonas TaxID=196821 RepID=UPI00272BDBEF|nr:hypothetical protein [Pseudomonas sp. OVF7]WLD65469.1 hypothetical protein QU606_24370 [Pseudomonas sp. OVF7]